MSSAHLHKHNSYLLISVVFLRLKSVFYCDIVVGGRALDEGRCVAECAKGKYQSGGQCHLCDHTCATCLDAGPANCTSCDTGED